MNVCDWRGDAEAYRQQVRWSAIRLLADTADLDRGVNPALLRCLAVSEHLSVTLGGVRGAVAPSFTHRVQTMMSARRCAPKD